MINLALQKDYIIERTDIKKVRQLKDDIVVVENPIMQN